MYTFVGIFIPWPKIKCFIIFTFEQLALELLSSGYGVAPLPRKNPNDRFHTSQYDIEVLDKQRRNYTWLATSDFYI